MSENFYITTTLPYVNSDPHIGFALEIVRADALARWHRAAGEEVFFNTGVDEHGLKIYRKAEELGVSPQAYCDSMAAKFADLRAALNLSYDNFIRTTDESHIAAVQEFWKRSLANDDIYKKVYQVKYCVGCELEKTDSELVNDRCPDHPNQDLESIDEENYFFRFSKYQQKLLDLYVAQPDFVVPATKLNEITKFVERGLEDFSVSRLKAKMPWGVAVPNDDEQVMYVWFDALVNYISCLSWPHSAKATRGTPQFDKADYGTPNSIEVDVDLFAKFWPGMQICGKDNLRQQTAMWQAMLMSVNLPTSCQVLINGFITANGQKMSKSLGNVVNPLELTSEFGTDALRYYLLGHINAFEDSDFTMDKFKAVYAADLANGLGNLVSRVATLYAKFEIDWVEPTALNQDLITDVNANIAKFNFNEALQVMWAVLRAGDEKLSNERPWKMTEVAEIEKCLKPLANDIYTIAGLLEPLLPETASKIKAIFKTGKIVKAEGLFPRKD